MDPQSREFVPQQTRKIGVTRRSVSGFFPFRGIKSIEYESSLERDFLVRTEFSLRVRDIVPQPAQIPFVTSDGQTYVYPPDFWVRFDDLIPPTLIEVKYKTEWQDSWRESLPKWKAAWRYARERGWQFRIVDESRVRDLAFENIRFLQRYRSTYFSSDAVRKLLGLASDLGTASIQTLLAHYGNVRSDRSDNLQLIHHLLATRQLDCDIGRPLDGSLHVWIANHGTE